MTELLPTVPEDGMRALAVVARPDDMEYGEAGIAAIAMLLAAAG